MVRFPMSPDFARKSGHVAIHAGSIGLAVFMQMISSIISTLAKDSYVPNALFQTSAWNVSETFPLEVTMDWWSGSYWIMTDLWSIAWLFYAVVSLFKRNVLGPESCNPEIHPPVFYLTWTMMNTARVCSMILWVRHDILGAVTLGWFLPVFSFHMFYMSCSNLHKCKDWLAINSPGIISWTRYLTQNGLAAFAWWSLLNSVVGLGIVLKYKAGVSDTAVSTIVLTIVTLCTVIWFILQSLMLAKYLRYTFSVYATLILGVGAMFTRSYRFYDMGANTVFCGFLMLLMTVMSMIHLMSECMHTNESSRPLDVEPHLRASEVCKTVYQPEAYVKHKLQK